MPKFLVTGLKDQKFSADGKDLILTFTTKYIGDMDLEMPAACLDEVIESLQRMRPSHAREISQSAAAPHTNGATPPAGATPPTGVKTQPGVAQALPDKAAAVSGTSAQLRVTMPKTWLVTADVKTRGVVLLVFDHQTEARVGFALNGAAAKEMAGGLVKNAEAVLAFKEGKKEVATEGRQSND